MKKIIVFFAMVCAMVLMIGCGGNSSDFGISDNNGGNGGNGESNGDGNGSSASSDNPTDDPTNPTDEPTNPTDDPTNPTDEPTNPTDEPTNPTGDPTNPTEEPIDECTLDESIINGTEKHYFGFKGIGKINDSHENNPSMASLVKTSIVGFDGKDLDYATDNSFYIKTYLTGRDADGNHVDIPAVAVEAHGDPNMSTGRFTTIAFAAVSIPYIDAMKENGIDTLPTAPATQIIDILYTSDDAYVRECILAANKYGRVEELGGETVLGEFQVCYDKNTDFSVGETFKLAMRAELAVGQEIVDMYSDVDSLDDLCTCFDMNAADDGRVDCQTIPEFATDPTDPTEENPCDPNPCEEGETCAAADNEAGYSCTPAETLTCNAEEHKELNEAGDACVCMTGYTENETTHACEAE